MRNRLTLALLLACSLSAEGFAQTPDTGEPVLQVDLNRRGVIEVELNLMAKPTLWISAIAGDSPVTAVFEVEGVNFTTSDLLLQFTPCKGSRDDQPRGLNYRLLRPADCQIKVSNLGARRAGVLAPPRGMYVAVTGKVTGETGVETSVTRMVKFELNYRYFDLGWSGGYMVSLQRDDRYTMSEPANETRTATLVERGDEKRAIVALGTMHWTTAPAVGFTFGVGTESAELNDLSLLAGLSFAFRPRRVVDSVILSVGGVYIARETLKPEYAGTGAIPAGVELGDVLTTTRNVKPFISISFRTSGSAAAVRGPLGGNTPE